MKKNALMTIVGLIACGYVNAQDQGIWQGRGGDVLYNCESPVQTPDNKLTVEISDTARPDIFDLTVTPVGIAGTAAESNFSVHLQKPKKSANGEGGIWAGAGVIYSSSRVVLSIYTSTRPVALPSTEHSATKKYGHHAKLRTRLEKSRFTMDDLICAANVVQH